MTARTSVLILVPALIVVILAAPGRAVMPPGSYEHLAAGAQYILIGRVVAVRPDSRTPPRFVNADIEVLATARGNLAPGQKFVLKIDLPSRTDRMRPGGASCLPHQASAVKPGRVYLLFLNYYRFRAHGQLWTGYAFAAHFCKTLRLDGPQAAARGRIIQAHQSMDPRTAGKVRGILTRVYLWAHGWVKKR